MNQATASAVIFGLTYLGIAFGGIPRLAIDRTGIALLGAIAVIASGVLTPKEAFGAIDMPTILLLYGLMVVSAQLRLAGFYTETALKISRNIRNPRLFLMKLMLVSAMLSALLANDIVCLAFTPVICVSVMRAGLNPVPFLIGLAASSNIGSAATLIGNPQNMLIGQSAGLDFGAFALWCIVPSALSLMAAWAVIARIYRNGFHLPQSQPAAGLAEDWPVFDRHQTAKGLVFAAVMVIMFFTPVSREVSAIAVAGILLLSRRMHTRSMLGLVDWHLITLFCGLFIVVGAIEKAGIPAMAAKSMAEAGFSLSSPVALTVVTLILSNIVSNVPAVMVLLPELQAMGPKTLYLLALVSTFAGNLILIGSIANLITVEQASLYGVKITFREHIKSGVPVTLVSCSIALVWALLF